MTGEDVVKRLLRFHDPIPLQLHEYPTLETFHEWNVEFALAKFRAKQSNNELVTFFNFRRPSSITVLETPYESDVEKYAIQQTIREVCRLDPSVVMVSSLCEMWIAEQSNNPVDPSYRAIDRYGEVRKVPGREDGLMVATFHRNGKAKVSKWVVKLKHNPANNRILARDDVETDEASGMQWYGANFGFFRPERSWREGEQTKPREE